MPEKAADAVPDGDPAASDKNALGRRRRIDSERARRRRVARRSEFIIRGLLFDEIDPQLSIAPEPMGYEATRRHVEEVDKYFEADIELFPDFYGGFLPRDYFRIYRDEIEEKFHTDTQARDLCGELRHVMNKNFVSLIIAKRLFVPATALGVYLTTQFYRLNQAEVADTLLFSRIAIPQATIDAVVFGLIMTVGAVAFVLANVFTFMSFEHKSSQSCSRIGSELQSILKDIESAYRDALEKIQTDENRGAKLKDEWPDRAAWWSRLILWYPKRVEFIEKTFQIAMWRVRSWFAWCYIGGMVALVAVAALTVGLAIWADRLTHWGPGMTAAFAAFVLVLSGWSYWRWRPSLDFVRENTRVANWNRFSRFRVDDRLAEMMAQDKHKIIAEQRRQSGGHH